MTLEERDARTENSVFTYRADKSKYLNYLQVTEPRGNS